MRIFDYIENRTVKKGFSDCFGIPLSDAQKSHLGISHLEFYCYIMDENENVIAFMMKYNGKYGAISAKGELYADTIYKYFRGLKQIGISDNKQDLWKGEKDNGLYDIFDKCELIYEDARNAAYITDNYTGEKSLQYAQIITETGCLIYDLENKKFFNFKLKDSVSSIHSKHKLILTDKDEKNSSGQYYHIYTLFDFDGNELGQFIAEPHHYIDFSEHKDFFIMYHNYKCGLYKLVNGVFEEVLPDKYRKIKQVFDDKAVVINTQNCVKVVHFEKKMKKGVETWTTKLDSYKLPKDVVDGFFLEDESEAILTLSNNKKMLLSVFLEYGVAEDKQCEEIVHLGNRIFKCFQFNDTDMANITFMSEGQSIPEITIEKENGYVVEANDYKQEHILFTPDGKLITKGVDSNHSVYKYASLKRFNYYQRHIDFMTIPKDEAQNVVEFSDYGGIGSTSYVYNLLKGTESKYRFSEFMMWHNIYMGNDTYDTHIVRGDDSLVNNLREMVAGFNDYAVFDDFRHVYVIDRNFNITSYDKMRTNENAYVDEIFQLCTIITKDKAIVVSNNGIEEFQNTGKTITLPNGKNVEYYKSNTSKNIVLATGVYVYAEDINYEIITGLIDRSYADLLN